MKPLEIWSPRFSTGDACIVASKVRDAAAVYSIYFSKTKSWNGNDLEGKRYIMRGHEIHMLGKKERTKQGNKLVYSVPMDILLTFEQAAA